MNTKVKKCWIFIKPLLFLMILIWIIYRVTLALVPKIPDFYKEKQWDVVFFGTSQAYCSFDPSIFDQYGLKTYNRGRQQQPMEYTYYYVEDAFEQSDIDFVVLEVFGMLYAEESDIHWAREVRDSSFNDFRYSLTKLKAIYRLVDRNEWASYIFPLDKYHTNWELMDFSSIKSAWDSVTNPYYTEASDRGFWGWDSSQPMDYLSEEELNNVERLELWKNNVWYLEHINQLCKEHGAKLILVKNPLPYIGNSVAMCRSLEDWAETNHVDFINFMLLTDEIGLDFNADSLDGGMHLNKFGADKVSTYLAEYIMNQKTDIN